MARTTLESAFLGVHDQGDSVLYLAQAASPHAIRHSAWIGQVVRLQGTAIGAALRDEVRPDGYVTTRQTVEPGTRARPPRRGRRVRGGRVQHRGPDVPAGRRHSREHRRADPEHARVLSAQLCGMKEQRWKRTER